MATTAMRFHAGEFGYIVSTLHLPCLVKPHNSRALFQHSARVLKMYGSDSVQFKRVLWLLKQRMYAARFPQFA